MAREDFDLFWRTNLVSSTSEIQIPQGSVLYWNVRKEDTNNFPWTRKEGTPRLHATGAVARELMTQVRVATRKTILSISMIQNWSPCSECSAEILKTMNLAKEKKVRLEITISFVGLNKIRRPSCIWRGFNNTYFDVTINESNDNALALRQLMDSGVTLTTFGMDTWKFLYTFLGNGLPSRTSDRFLGGKYSNCESRLEEDRLMDADFKQITKGLYLTSASISSSSSAIFVEWTHPVFTKEKETVYRVTYKKVKVKDTEAEDRSWRINHTMDDLGTKTTCPGYQKAITLTDLERDAFYDVKIEMLVNGLVTCAGRKIFKTDSKVPIPSLQSPVKKTSSTARQRFSLESASSVTSLSSQPGTPKSPRKLERSNSTKMASRNHVGNASNSESPTNRTGTLRRSNSTRSTIGRSTGVDIVEGRKKSGSVTSNTSGGVNGSRRLSTSSTVGSVSSCSDSVRE